MKYILYIITIIILSSTSIVAQSNLQGKIFDENKKTVFFATAVLYNQADSTIALSSSSDEEGMFKIKGIKDGNYYLKVSFVGYEDKIISDLIFPKNNNLELLIDLEPVENLISDVVVAGKKPLLEQQSDRLIVNVADNITSVNNTLMDVMKKVPGVIVIGDNISLAGATNLTILINGKTTKYMDISSLLKDMPGDNIDRVEIIHQPGAEFDAAGSGPIINIILKKNSLFGTFGSVKMGMSKAESWRYNTDVSLNHYQGDVNIGGSLGYRNAGYRDVMTIVRDVKGDSYSQISDNFSHYTSYRGNLSLDWDITKKHKVGFQSRVVSHASDNLIDNNTIISFLADSILNQVINTKNTNDGYWRLGSINPYYVFEIDSLGQKIDFDINYIQFGSNSDNLLIPTDMTTNQTLTKQNYLQPGNTKIFVTKLDYTYPFSTFLKLQVGGKYSLADLDNDFQSYYEANDQFVLNELQSNHYLFSESIMAAYSKLTYNKSKWSGTFGIRYEDSFSKGESVGVDTILTRTVKKFFPSASLSREIVKGLNGVLSYSYRLDRPRYSSLNPFRYALDSYTYQKGNPELLPEFTHSTKFSLTFQSQPFFNVEYKQSEDAMIDAIGQNDDTGEGYRTTINVDSKKVFNISLFFPLTFIPKLSGYGGIMVNNFQFYSPYLDQIYDVNKWDYTAFMQVGFTLPWRIQTELSGYYTSGGINGLVSYEHMYGMSVGLSKKLFKDRVKISAGADNLFTRFYYGKTNYSNINMTLNSKWESPVFNIQISYNFGNKHLSRANEHKSGASDELNRTGKN